MKIVASEKNPNDKVANKLKIMPNTFLDLTAFNKALIDKKNTANIKSEKIFTPI